MVFNRTKHLFKSSQTHTPRYLIYGKSKTPRFSSIAYIEKKLGFHAQFFCPIVKVGVFHRIKGLFKSTRFWNGRFQGFLRDELVYFTTPELNKEYYFLIIILYFYSKMSSSSPMMCTPLPAPLRSRLVVALPAGLVSNSFFLGM